MTLKALLFLRDRWGEIVVRVRRPLELVWIGMQEGHLTNCTWGPEEEDLEEGHNEEPLEERSGSKALLICGSGLETGREALWFPISEEFVDILFVSLDVTCCFLVSR